MSISEKEARARHEIVLDIIRAKHALGLYGRQKQVSFFKDIWPDILQHLKRTGYTFPHSET